VILPAGRPVGRSGLYIHWILNIHCQIQRQGVLAVHGPPMVIGQTITAHHHTQGYWCVLGLRSCTFLFSIFPHSSGHSSSTSSLLLFRHRVVVIGTFLVMETCIFAVTPVSAFLSSARDGRGHTHSSLVNDPK